MRPEAQLIGSDGNIFNILGIASLALRRAGQGAEAKEMADRATKAGSYDGALRVIMEYVDPVGPDEDEYDEDDWDGDDEYDDDEYDD